MFVLMMQHDCSRSLQNEIIILDYIAPVLCSKRGKINGPVRKTHSSVLVANSPEKHQRTLFANFENRSHLAVRKTHHGICSVWKGA